MTSLYSTSTWITSAVCVHTDQCFLFSAKDRDHCPPWFAGLLKVSLKGLFLLYQRRLSWATRVFLSQKSELWITVHKLAYCRLAAHRGRTPDAQSHLESNFQTSCDFSELSHWPMDLHSWCTSQSLKAGEMLSQEGTCLVSRRTWVLSSEPKWKKLGIACLLSQSWGDRYKKSGTCWLASLLYSASSSIAKEQSR